MRKHLYVIIPLIIALALRLYPTLISGLPYSTDAWAPIRNTELIIEHTPIHLGDDEIFDGYNNYWPANSIFGAVLSQVTSLKPMDVMALAHPLAGALTILIFYVLVFKICKDYKIALTASILLATAFPHSLFTAGVTKETFANPLYLLVILLFLSQGKWKKILLFIIASTTLVLTHHLTALNTITILTSITLASSISRVKRILNIEKSSFLLLATLTATFAVYIGLYANTGFISLTNREWLSVAAFQVIAFTLSMYFASRSYTTLEMFFICTITTVAIFLLTILSLNKSLLPGAPKLPSRYLLYATPFILSSPLITLGWTRKTLSEQRIVPIFWASTILGVESYAAFSNTFFGSTLGPRMLNFLWPPLTILLAIGFAEYIYVKKPLIKRVVKHAMIVTISIVVILNAYNLYAAVSLQERHMVYFWLYRLPEYEAGTWITRTVNNQTVAGDIKITYLLRDYFDLKVDAIQGLRYLTQEGYSEPQILFTYDQMQKNGYVLYSGYVIDLPEDWVEKANNLNRIYSNGIVTLYGAPRH